MDCKVYLWETKFNPIKYVNFISYKQIVKYFFLVYVFFIFVLYPKKKISKK